MIFKLDDWKSGSLLLFFPLFVNFSDFSGWIFVSVFSGFVQDWIFMVQMWSLSGIVTQADCSYSFIFIHFSFFPYLTC